MSYLPSARAQFEYYEMLGAKTLDRLSDAQLQHELSPESNSVATTVKHLHGNMLSRWTDFLTDDGEKPWRDREGEFSADGADKAEVLRRYDEGWAAVFAALDAVEADGNLERLVYIRAKGHTVVEAINRQLCHYAYHVGQIVFVGRLLLGAEWVSLSIAKGESVAYNQKSFAEGKRREHFTEEFLKE